MPMQEMRVPGASTDFERSQAFAAAVRQQSANAVNQYHQRQQSAERQTREENLNLVKQKLEEVDQMLAIAKQKKAEAWQRGDGYLDGEATSEIVDLTNKRHILDAGALELEEQLAEVTPPARPTYRDGNVIREVPRLTVSEQIDRIPDLKPLEREWLKKHPERLNDPAGLQATLQYAARKGIARGSKELVALFDEDFGYAPAKHDRRVLLSDQKDDVAGISMIDAARISGANPREYALGVERLRAAKAAGNYRDY